MSSGRIVPSGVPWMAPCDPLEPPPHAAPCAILPDGFDRIRRTCGIISTGVGRKKGGQKNLVSADDESQYALHEQLRSSSVEISALHKRAISLRIEENVTRSTGRSRFPLKTKRIRAEQRDACSAERRLPRSCLNASRMSRRRRFLRTALHVLRGTANPVSTRAVESFSTRCKQRISSPSTRRPEAYSLLKVSRPRRVSCFFTYRSSLTVSFLRPRARRRARTFLPSLLAIRSRNPCVFFRFLLCG